MIDETWLRESVGRALDHQHRASSVDELRELLLSCAEEFARTRSDVETPSITWPRRGLCQDEAASFLRAVAEGFAQVDPAGFVTLPAVRPKSPEGRYALLSKSGAGVSINLEYLIQIGATAELVLDLGWPPEAIDFERGEFDALGSGPDGRVVLAMEAKARVTGPDSLEKLVPFRLRVAAPVLGLGRPVWVDTRGIDLDRHIHAAAVPRPGTPQQLADLAGELFARPLPRDRPLWQLWFVEGLESCA